MKKMTQDTKQRLFTSMYLCLEFYKILMGTFLIAFVPQKCGDNTCSIMDNINNQNPINRVATLFNLLTFCTVLTFYGIELKRENWCITYLDIDKNLPNNNLDTEIEKYPDLKKNMHRLNSNYTTSIYAAIGMLSLNFSLSTWAIMCGYNGSGTANALISFFMLIALKFKNAWTIGRLSMKNERAFSGYLKIARTYNTIDSEHKDFSDGFTEAYVA